jgi:hypothetical protein
MPHSMSWQKSQPPAIAASNLLSIKKHKVPRLHLPFEVKKAALSGGCALMGL